MRRGINPRPEGTQPLRMKGFRATPEAQACLTRLVELGGYASESEAIRQALAVLLERLETLAREGLLTPDRIPREK